MAFIRRRGRSFFRTHLVSEDTKDDKDTGAGRNIPGGDDDAPWQPSDEEASNESDGDDESANGSKKTNNTMSPQIATVCRPKAGVPKCCFCRALAEDFHRVPNVSCLIEL